MDRIKKIFKPAQYFKIESLPGCDMNVDLLFRALEDKYKHAIKHYIGVSEEESKDGGVLRLTRRAYIITLEHPTEVVEKEFEDIYEYAKQLVSEVFQRVTITPIMEEE